MLLLREAFCGIEYAENAFVENVETPLHPTRDLRRSGLPLQVVSGIATGLVV